LSSQLIEHIISDFRQYGKPILMVEDVYRFLQRDDVAQHLNQNKILISTGSNLSQRIRYHNADNSTLHLFITNPEEHLEDILQIASSIIFSIGHYLDGYHLDTIAELSLEKLDRLYLSKPITKLSQAETLNLLPDQKQTALGSPTLSLHVDQINQQLNKEDVNWHIVLSLLSDVVIGHSGSLDDNQFDNFLKEVNSQFQDYLLANHKSLINSSSINKPKLVSKVLDHIEFNYKGDKVALVVVDGFSYWQYKMLSRHLSAQLKKVEDILHSWIPSITQLSRQAIFRGDVPDKEYVQNPTNEKKLWFKYWEGKGFTKDEIDYQHDPKEYKINNRTKRLGIVFKDLDDKMHSSSDYNDLRSLTENWFERSDIVSYLDKLTSSGFQVILTTDHGNVEAQGWRTLSGREKLGTNNKSGSRSQRHIEYTDEWLVREFVNENEEIRPSIVVDEQAIYFTDIRSFSKEKQLVTHGGSHIFEVLIPFIKLSKD